MTSKLNPSSLQYPPQTQISVRTSLYYQLCQETHLTKREQELLQWLSFGYSYIEMSEEMNLSINTIKKYFFLLRDKFNAKDNSHLLCIVFRGGLLSLNSPQKQLLSDSDPSVAQNF